MIHKLFYQCQQIGKLVKEYIIGLTKIGQVMKLGFWGGGGGAE